jgi:hypothetical protein
MELLYHGLIYGGWLSLVMSILIIGSMYFNPEIWLHDFPADIQEKYGPASPKSLRQRKIFTIPFMLIFLGILAASVWTLPNVVDGSPTFLQLFVNLFIVFETFNLVDLLILDWLFGIVIQPKSAILPGTAGLQGYKDYGFHFRGFIKGSIGGVIGALVLAGIAWLLFYLF